MAVFQLQVWTIHIVFSYKQIKQSFKIMNTMVEVA